MATKAYAMPAPLVVAALSILVGWIAWRKRLSNAAFQLRMTNTKDPSIMTGEPKSLDRGT
jgi:hypothetical protein